MIQYLSGIIVWEKHVSVYLHLFTSRLMWLFTIVLQHLEKVTDSYMAYGDGPFVVDILKEMTSKSHDFKRSLVHLSLSLLLCNNTSLLMVYEYIMIMPHLKCTLPWLSAKITVREMYIVEYGSVTYLSESRYSTVDSS